MPAVFEFISHTVHLSFPVAWERREGQDRSVLVSVLCFCPKDRTEIDALVIYPYFCNCRAYLVPGSPSNCELVESLHGAWLSGSVW